MKALTKVLLMLSALWVGLFNLACTRERAQLGTEANPVKFFFVPSVDAHVLTEKTKTLKEYLEANTPYKFKIQVPSSFVAVVEAFGTNRADVASINTFGYILANERYGAEAMLTVERYGETEYKGQFITRADSKINTLKDIEGKKIAYVDPASTSGYLLPATVLKKLNINPSEKVFAQRHDNVVTMVYQGQVDVGATFYSPPHDGTIQDARRLVKTQIPDVEDKIKILELTTPIPNDPIIFRKDLTPEMKSSIQEALLKYIATPEGKSAFSEMYSVTNMVKSTDKSYDGVREILTALGKSASDLVKK